MTVTREVEVKLSPAELAEQFWNMGDDEQCQFFVEVKKVSEEDAGSFAAEMQWASLGRMARKDPDVADAIRTLSAFVWMEEWGLIARRTESD